MPQGYAPGNNMGAGAQGTYAAPPIAYMVPPQMGQFMVPPHQMMPPNMQTHHHSGFPYGPPGGGMPPMQPPMRSYNPPASNITVLPPNSSISVSSHPTPSRPIGRLVTLFIGGIPEGISDENIEAILQVGSATLRTLVTPFSHLFSAAVHATRGNVSKPPMGRPKSSALLISPTPRLC